MIKAKGGRERLYSVESVYRALHWKKPTKESGYLRDRELFVLPDRYWAWLDWSGTVFGLEINVYNLRQRVSYSTGKSTGQHVWENDSGYPASEFLRDLQLVHLLETRWLEPEPIAAWDRKEKGRRIRTVRALVGDEILEYSLEEQQVLPFRIRRSWFLSVNPDREEYQKSFNLADYRDVSGIMLAHTVRWQDGKLTRKEQAIYEINPSYDPLIFDRQPVLKDGPEAWRSKP
jgi:hypothetical protein